MEVLKLNGNKIGDEGALALSTCLTKVNCLDITQCGISEGFRAMAAAIKNFPFDVSSLTLSTEIKCFDNVVYLSY